MGVTMKKVGITGQHGFIGNHLFNYLGLKENIELVSFDKSYFQDEEKLQAFVKNCDTIVHLAAMNRHPDPQHIYDVNVGLVKELIAACEKTQSTPHVLFSSTTQEEKNNLYGKSKMEGRTLLEQWTERSGAKTTGLVIPNVFGPFGKPNYNSVVATFCHKMTHDEPIEIHVDGQLKLIYVNELIEVFYQKIENGETGRHIVPHSKEIKVSEIASLLEGFKNGYLEKGVFPNITDPFELSLFNTFRCYIPESYYPFSLTKHTDDRGSFVEIVRANSTGQFSYSTTKPGITRGNHFHTRKAERFAVIQGKAEIQLRRIGTDKVTSYIIDGASPQFVDMPIWHTHNIKNIGDEILITLFWINEPYNPDDADTYFVNV